MDDDRKQHQKHLAMNDAGYPPTTRTAQHLDQRKEVRPKIG